MTIKQTEEILDSNIHNYLTGTQKHSFLLYAGAGSGKTRTLVNVLEMILKSHSEEFRLRGKKIAVITYTNAACDEIKRRVKFNKLIDVSTIHSFLWELIRHYSSDIKSWLMENIAAEIADLRDKQSRTTRVSQASLERERKIVSKEKRLQNLSDVYKFTYNPTGDNRTKDSLNHSEVIKLGSYFLDRKYTMQKILVNRHPILLIDESQDTNKLLMNALLEVEKNNRDTFSVGLLGDMMQRIYSDGKSDLEACLDEHWKKPEKSINYRSPKRVVALINLIRSQVDNHKQKAREDAEEGYVRIFIKECHSDNKDRDESFVKKRMREITLDDDWENHDSLVNTLILEHHMAATRMGFIDMFTPLYQIERLKTGLLEGSLGNINFICGIVSPLISACIKNDTFTITNILRTNAPLLKREHLLKNTNNTSPLTQIRNSLDMLKSFISTNPELITINLLHKINEIKLLDIPDSIQEILESNDNSQDDIIEAWQKAFSSPLCQFDKYYNYVKGKTNIDTHQGVKGLEFPRVLVLIDDSEAKGFMFSYDKLFGVKEKTKTDLDNEKEGKDTSEDRTRRLFYVTCSRAQKSLAILAYTDNTEMLRKNLLHKGWFDSSEIEII